MDMTLIPFADTNIGNQRGYVKYNIALSKDERAPAPVRLHASTGSA
jgi:hypothetical protein